MTGADPWHDAWTRLDQTSDPSWFVRFLDASRGPQKQRAEANPQAYFAFLDVREGQRVLEVGCGPGDLTQILARLVGSGEVVGLDYSATMVAEAHRRMEGQRLPLRFVTGDVHALEFPDEAFDRSYAMAVFQHLHAPHRALDELIRVTRRGGRVVVADHDWYSWMVSADDEATSQVMTRVFADSIPNGGIAHHLPVLFKDHGLTDVQAEPLPVPLWPVVPPPVIEMATRTAQRAAGTGQVSAEDAQRWAADVSQRAAQQRLFSTFTIWRVSGIRP